jgi:anhydro-N-acetylmuramic acid kinase
MLTVGLMSGTSLDGIDAALVKISERDDQVNIKLLGFESIPYPQELKQRLKHLLPPNPGSVKGLARMHFYLGQKLAEAALGVIEKAHLSPSEIDLIGSHGQTICNLPMGKNEFSPHSRLQIGDVSVIAVKTGITTVGDFRPADVAAGGEGAPLIPYFDYYAFHSPNKSRVILNIGGIANVTYIPAGAGLEGVKGFDTGPGNMLLDGLVSALTDGREVFDQDGHFAGKGIPCIALLKELMSSRFIHKHPPKSAGREEFGDNFLKELINKASVYRLSAEDLIATTTAFTAEAIAYNCKHFLGPVAELIVGGGGAFNKTLLAMLQKHFLGARVTTTEEYGIPIKAKEAMGFALLAYQAFHRRYNNVPSVTGAKHPVVMGKITWGR